MIKKLDIGHLDTGMYIVELDRSWLETPFFFHEKLITGTETIDRLKEYGIKYVYIDTEKGKDTEKATAKHEVDKKIHEELTVNVAPKPHHPSVPTNEEYRIEMLRAVQVKQEATTAVTSMMHDVRMGKNIDNERIENMAGSMVETSLRNPDALLSLARLKSFDAYTFVHSVNVSILALSLARALNIDIEGLKQITVGGLIHDIGKMRVPAVVLNKPGKLNPDELEVMKTHVALGHEFAKTIPGLSKVSLDVLAQHHERTDGTGYPGKLKGAQLSPFGQIASIVDVYDAITSKRVYHQPMNSFDGLRKMYEWSEGAFKREYVEEFIRFLGLYPPSTLVRLADHKLAVVWKVNRENLSEPVVITCYDSSRHHYCQPELRDLSNPLHSGSKIVAVENPKRWGIEVEDFL